MLSMWESSSDKQLQKGLLKIPHLFSLILELPALKHTMKIGNYCEPMFINIKGWGRKRNQVQVANNENPIHVLELYLFITRCGKSTRQRKGRKRSDS